MRRTTARWLCSLAVLLSACGDDNGPEAVTAADYDSTTQAIVTTGPVRQLSAWLLTSGPMASELKADLPQPSDYTCEKTLSGTCPTLTVKCDLAKQLLSATLDYRATDSCKDASGVPLKGIIVLTRKAVRDWTATLDKLDRNGVVFNGTLGFTGVAGGPWTLTVTALQVTGSVSGSSTDPSCSQSCVKSQTYTFNTTLTFSTGTPISVAVDLLGQKSVVMNGSLNATGNVTGHVKVVTRGPLGKDYTAVDRDLNASFQNRGLTFKDVSYPLPLSCTCPASGSLSATSLSGCGELTVSFAKSSTGGSCSTSTASYTSSDKTCQYTGQVVELGVDEACLPISL